MAMVPAALRISEEAQDLVLSHLSTAASYSHARTLVALCLVHPLWLSSTRRALYLDPLVTLASGRYTSNWTRATQLLETLTNNPRLGRNVRSLHALMEYVQRLPERTVMGRKDKPVWAMRGESIKCAFAVSLVAACPLLRVLSPAFTNVRELELVMEAVNVEGSLQELELGNNAGWCISMDALRPILVEHGSIETLVVHHLSHDDEDASDTAMRSNLRDLRLRLKSLSVLNPHVPFTRMIDLIPSASCLQHLVITATDIPTPDSLLSLLTIVGSTLRTLDLTVSSASSYDRGSITNYGRHHVGTNLPLAMFSLLPALRDLTLEGFRNMSLARLEILALHSPHLVSIDLESSIWASDKSSVPAPSPSADWIFPSIEIGGVLKKQFPALERIHFGWVPVIAGAKLQGMKEVMQARQELRITYETCGSMCHGCGGYH